MEALRPHRSPGSERFLGLFTDAPPPITNTSVELNEDDVFWIGIDPSDDSLSLSLSATPTSLIANPNPNPNPNHGPSMPKSRLSRLSHRNFGILAALPEEDDVMLGGAFLQRKPSFASMSLADFAPSPPSAERKIPTARKTKAAEHSISVPARKVFHQSAPVNVPMASRRKEWGESDFDRGGDADGDGDEEEMLPPHEIVARASGKDSPMTTFSVLEGVGRTLKGRDLRRVRNAVWRQTGFLD